MSNETYLALQHSEARVASIAATIYAAYIGSRDIDDSNEDEYLRKAVAAAVKLVVHVDKIVMSDEEWSKPGAKPGQVL